MTRQQYLLIASNIAAVGVSTFFWVYQVQSDPKSIGLAVIWLPLIIAVTAAILLVALDLGYFLATRRNLLFRAVGFLLGGVGVLAVSAWALSTHRFPLEPLGGTANGLVTPWPLWLAAAVCVLTYLTALFSVHRQRRGFS